MYATAFCAIPLSIFALIVNTLPARNEFDYSLRQQLKDVIPQTLMTAVMGGFVFLARIIPGSTTFRLLVQIMTGILVYTGLSYVTKNRDFYFILKYLGDTFSKLKKVRQKKQTSDKRDYKE